MTSLIVFARAPIEGRVKTRLARGIGAPAALALYTAFLADVCALAGTVDARRILAVEGPLDHPRDPAAGARERHGAGGAGAGRPGRAHAGRAGGGAAGVRDRHRRAHAPARAARAGAGGGGQPRRGDRALGRRWLLAAGPVAPAARAVPRAALVDAGGAAADARAAARPYARRCCRFTTTSTRRPICGCSRRTSPSSARRWRPGPARRWRGSAIRSRRVPAIRLAPCAVTSTGGGSVPAGRRRRSSR